MARKGTRNVFKRGDTWSFRARIDGKDVWRGGYRSERLAATALADFRRDAQGAAMGFTKSKVSTLEGFRDTYLKWARRHKRSADRDERSLKFLVARLGALRLNDLTKARIDAYQNDRLADGVKGSTVNREVACLRKLLSRAVDVGELRDNPLRGVTMLPEPPARQPSLDHEQEAALLKAASPDWLRVMIRIALATGARKGEILGLHWKDLDFEGGAAIIRDSKSGQSRRVPVHPSVLTELYNRRQHPEAPVVLNDDGEPPTPNAAVQAWIRVRNKVGLGDMRFHDLRHVAGSRLLAAGASLPEVADWLGHKTLHMARRYAHTNPTRLRELVGKIALVDGVGEGGEG